MTDLVRFEFDDQHIRQDGDNISIFDTICVIGGKSYDATKKLWKRLCDDYPEVGKKSHYFKFPGRGQRNTPVTNREGILEIIGLLPGAVGNAYRQDAAKLFAKFLDADIELADNIIQRQTDPEKLKWIQERAEGKLIRHQFTQELTDRGVTAGNSYPTNGFAQNTDAINVALFDQTAKDLRLSRQVRNTRDGMSQLELAAVRFAELGAIQKMRKQNALGNQETTNCSRQAGDNVREALDKMK